MLDMMIRSCGFQCSALNTWTTQLDVGNVSVYCDGVGCHVLCLYTVTGWGVMSCVYTVTGWGVMSCVCILWRGGVSCPVSVYCDRVGCHVLCLYTVMGWGVMSCVCILWRGGVSCPVSVYCDRVGCHVLCLYCDGVGCHVMCQRHNITFRQHYEWSEEPLLEVAIIAQSDVKHQQSINHFKSTCVHDEVMNCIPHNRFEP